MSADLEGLTDWIGRTETREDMIAVDRVAAMAATLDQERAPGPGDTLPPGWHWLFFNPAVRAAEIGPDGHTQRGGFLPPVPLPRRMWAGGRLAFHAPLKVGEIARRESEILKVEAKSGRSGALVFVTVRHRLSGGAGLGIEEEHDIVYRPLPAQGVVAPAPPPAPTDGVWRREIRPDPVLLFRYSALTFNGHRIHYDHPYVTQVEGYPGLIVHGPLIATFLMDLAHRERPGALRHFAFRAISPLFETAPFSVQGTPDADGTSARLWATGPGDALAMSADAVLAAK